MRYDDEKIAKRLAYDTTLLFVSNGTSHIEDSTNNKMLKTG
jgi:hypothetical protein